MSEDSRETFAVKSQISIDGGGRGRTEKREKIC